MTTSNLFACVTEPYDGGNGNGSRTLVRWLRRIPESIVSRLPPVTVSSVTGVQSSLGETAGFLISPNLGVGQYRELPQELLVKKLIRTAGKAARLGARIVGLGPAASAAGDGGVLVAQRCRAAVTTGRSFAVAAALEACRKLLLLNGIDLEEASVAVTGAADPAAAAAARFLAQEGVNHLSLSGDDFHRLDALARAIIYESGVSCKISSSASRAADRADLVIYGDSVPAPFNFSCLKPGTVLCGLDGAPGLADLARRVRDDLLVVEGALITLPGDVCFSHDPGPGINANTVFAWMIEAMILAMEGRFESYSLGRLLRVGRITEIWRMAVRHGFTLAGFYGSRRRVGRELIWKGCESFHLFTTLPRKA